MPYHAKLIGNNFNCLGYRQQKNRLNELSALIMAECCVEEIDGNFNYLNNIDVARKAKFFTQFIMYHIELKTGINLNLIEGDNNDIEHTDEENDADTMNNSETNLSAEYNDAYNDVMTDNNVAVKKFRRHCVQLQ